MVRLYTGYDKSKKIIFNFDKETRSIANQFGNSVWLKLERNEHNLTAYCSGDGNNWVLLGDPISAVNLDKAQPNWNSWVGTSVGLFAEGKPSDFDFFICKDAFSSILAAGYSNYYGVKTIKKETEKVVNNTSENGGWFMISGVEMGKKSPSAIEVVVSSGVNGKLEIWLDDLKNGKLIATIPVKTTKGENDWKTFSKTIKNITGHHDVFVKFPEGKQGAIYIKSLKFMK
jgi:xylan 1,4-beta-xylosidase